MKNEGKGKQWLKSDSLGFLERSELRANGCIHLQSLKWQSCVSNGTHRADQKPLTAPLNMCPTVTLKQDGGGCASYLVNWRSLASMLRCLMHILVRAEPISLVAPGNTKQTVNIWGCKQYLHYSCKKALFQTTWQLQSYCVYTRSACCRHYTHTHTRSCLSPK